MFARCAEMILSIDSAVLSFFGASLPLPLEEPLGATYHSVAWASAGAASPATGMAAVDLAFCSLEPGDLLIAPHDCYGGTCRLLNARARKGHFDLLLVDQGDPEALDRALVVRFGYILTGNAETDRISEAGLASLSSEVTRRSSIEPEAPRGIDPDEDELIFFPLIYWPVSADARPVSEAAAANINTYLRSGGMIIFDTRDGGAGTRGGAHPGLEQVMQGLEIPALARLDAEHVLGRTFYLLRGLPGRLAGGDVWVESNPDGTARDGVSGVIIGSADWAGAWARGDNGIPLLPVEGGERQREMAYRVGVNLAMYALTGNYKTDQVHVPAILERLGQGGPRGTPRSLEP